MFVPLQLNQSNLQRLLTSLGGIVNTWSAGSTGLTPSSPTSGNVVLAGTLNVANGGTGSTTSTGTAASGVVLRTSPTINSSLTVSGAANSTALAVSSLLNTTASAVNVMDYNVTVTSSHASSLIRRIRGGASATTVLEQLDTSGNSEIAGYAAIGRAAALTAGGATSLSLRMGDSASGIMGVFAGIGSPTFNPLGRAGGIYLNATTTAGAPGIPSYNVDGSATGWQTLVGREATQTLTNKTLSGAVLSNCTGFPTATFVRSSLASNTTIVTQTALVNTGSIGANGQTWMITAFMSASSSNANGQFILEIFNGSAVVAAQAVNIATANFGAGLSCMWMGTLSAATTFTLRGTGSVATSTAFGESAGSGPVTVIHAVRLS